MPDYDSSTDDSSVRTAADHYDEGDEDTYNPEEDTLDQRAH